MKRWAIAGVGAVLCATAIPVAEASSSAATSHASLGQISATWQSDLQGYDLDNPIGQSSPTIANINGTADKPTPAIVVGDRTGRLYASDLSTGRTRVLFSSSVPIDAPPSAASLTGTGFDTVFFGRGNRGVACQAADGTWGGYTAVNADASVLWKRRVNNPVGDTLCAHNGVGSGMTLYYDNGILDTVGMSLGQSEYAMNATTGAVLPGWNPWFQGDSGVSTPAVARLNGPSKSVSIIEGGDSTGGLAYGAVYQNGGHVRVIRTTGNKGVLGEGGLKCAFDTYANGGQIVESSPAVGPFLANGATGIVSGQGYFSPFPGSPNMVYALNTSCQVVWSHQLDQETSSPILADITGTGRLDVIIATQAVSTGGSVESGSVYAFNGATGKKLWRVDTGSVLGSPVAADLTGSGSADILVETPALDKGGLQIIDGATGNKIWQESQLSNRDNPQVGGQSTPIVTSDPNGKIGITVAGYHGVLVGGSVHLSGDIVHFQIAGSKSSWLANPLTSWLEFHHDPMLTGNTAGPGV